MIFNTLIGIIGAQPRAASISDRRRGSDSDESTEEDLSESASSSDDSLSNSDDSPPPTRTKRVTRATRRPDSDEDAGRGAGGGDDDEEEDAELERMRKEVEAYGQDFYIDDKDRRELQKMTELDRQTILAEREEKVGLRFSSFSSSVRSPTPFDSPFPHSSKHIKNGWNSDEGSRSKKEGRRGDLAVEPTRANRSSRVDSASSRTSEMRERAVSLMSRATRRTTRRRRRGWVWCGVGRNTLSCLNFAFRPHLPAGLQHHSGPTPSNRSQKSGFGEMGHVSVL